MYGDSESRSSFRLQMKGNYIYSKVTIGRITYHYILKQMLSRYGSVSKATGFELDNLGSVIGRRGDFLFGTKSSSALGPTQLSIQLVPAAKRPER
jgi:hypothetical protein